MSVWLAGALLGLAGSGHCVMMCGPLAAAVTRTLRPASRRLQVRRAMAYHSGRIAVYVLLALPVGLLGSVISVSGFGRVLSVSMGLVLAASVLRRSGRALPGRLGERAAAAAGWACGGANRWLRSHSNGPFLAGAVNGVLPCGLVYAAVTAAAATGSVRDSILLMAGFGCGTLPVLLALNLSARSLPHGLRLRLRQLTPVALVLIAALLIFRGLFPRGTHQHVAAPVSAHAAHP